MSSLFSFVLFVVWLVLFMRAAGFIRRAKARHRARLIELGMEEVNPAWRLRQDSYMRTFYIAYALIGGVINLSLSNNPVSPYLAFPFAAVIGFALAALVWFLRRSWVEINSPVGELITMMYHNQFKKGATPLVPEGQHGTAEKESPARAGILNPGFLFARPVAAAPGGKA